MDCHFVLTEKKLKNFVVLMQQNAYQGTLIYESIFKSVRKR